MAVQPGKARILCIIPAYNEQSCILNTVRTLKEQYPAADYVVINDCSRDDTLRILQENGLNYISLPVNLGIGGGVQTGYQYARARGYDIAIQFDGDGQHRADYIGRLIAPILAGDCDMAIGSRFVPSDEKGEGFQSTAMRRLGINFIRMLIRLVCGQTVYDTTSGFRACDRELISFFADNYAQDYPEPEAIVSAVTNGFRVREIPVQMNERQGGQSSIRALKSVHYMIKVSLAILISGTHLRRKGGR